MTPTEGPASDNARAYRMGRVAAFGTLLGIALSGPLAVALVIGTHPQPPWRDAELFLIAPSKKLVWFEQSGHEMFVDEPARFNDTMRELVRPVLSSVGN